MLVLSNLKLSNPSPKANLSPVARKRQKLLDQIDPQLKAAAAFVSGEQFAREVQCRVSSPGALCALAAASKSVIAKRSDK